MQGSKTTGLWSLCRAQRYAGLKDHWTVVTLQSTTLCRAQRPLDCGHFAEHNAMQGSKTTGLWSLCRAQRYARLKDHWTVVTLQSTTLCKAQRPLDCGHFAEPGRSAPYPAGHPKHCCRPGWTSGDTFQRDVSTSGRLSADDTETTSTSSTRRIIEGAGGRGLNHKPTTTEERPEMRYMVPDMVKGQK